MSSNGKVLGIDEILGSNDHKIEKVYVPEWGGSIYLRSIMGNDRDRIEDKVSKGAVVGLRAELVAASLCDQAGELIAKPEHVAKLGRKNALVLDRLFAKCQVLSGFGVDQQEELEGN